MKRKDLLFLFVFTIISSHVKAQLVNTGQSMAIEEGGLLFVDNDFIHQSGSVSNQGTLVVKGDWLNNDPNSNVFKNTSTGLVEFTGGKQQIGGSSKTAFFDVLLSGDGEKTLGADIDILSKLQLNNRELKAERFNLSVLNPDPGAITRMSGFVSTDKGGKLFRTTNSESSYLFPLGSALASDATPASPLYRPVIVEPQTSSRNSFSISLIPHDPGLDGYNRDSKRQDVQNISGKYYYLVSQEGALSKANYKFYRNISTGENSKQLVSWSKFQLWEKAAPSLTTDGNFSDNLNRYLLFTSIDRLNNLPVSFADLSPDITKFLPGPLTIFNAFSPDGDGKNDTWTIKNIELYPENNLTIVNRWGDEVFKARNYSNSKAWDGDGVMSGTYFYVLDVKVNGEKKIYKGFITVIKKD